MRIYICFFILFTLSCANIIPPEGGAKDTVPPEVISVFPNNKSINFKENFIEINFNEIISINSSNIYTLPDYNLISKVNISNKGKSAKIILNENLKDSTTYVIGFQNAISDINEGNTINNFKYTFSTGETIDSSTVIGKIISMKNNKEVENCLVGLFEGDISAKYDSIIREQKPSFFCFTNNLGEYKYENLRPGTYTMMSIKDDNLNLKYESSELISMPTVINLQDSIDVDILIFLDERYEGDQMKDTIIESNFANKDIAANTADDIGIINLFFQKKIYEPKNYIGQFIKNDSIINSFNINDSIMSFDNINTGTYQLKLIEDLNKNNTWDRGNIKNLNQPEKIIFLKDTIKVRAKWEQNIIVDI